MNHFQSQNIPQSSKKRERSHYAEGEATCHCWLKHLSNGDTEPEHSPCQMGIAAIQLVERPSVGCKDWRKIVIDLTSCEGQCCWPPAIEKLELCEDLASWILSDEKDLMILLVQSTLWTQNAAPDIAWDVIYDVTREWLWSNTISGVNQDHLLLEFDDVTLQSPTHSAKPTSHTPPGSKCSKQLWTKAAFLLHCCKAAHGKLPLPCSSL